MVYVFGGCKSTKDGDLQKFLIFDCDGALKGKSNTLKEAELQADKIGCAFVIKILRVCGEADVEAFGAGELFGAAEMEEEDLEE